jgi:mono/diheme cytochrome c family protein
MRTSIPWTVPLFLSALLIYSAAAPAGQPTKRPTDLDRGQQLWERHCWQCHGATNQGDGPAAASLVHTVPNLVGQMVVSDELARTILRGKGPMPGYEQSFDFHDARRVLKYQATLSAETDQAGTEPEDEPDPITEPTTPEGA